jgi:hydrogenase expression/formation protein
MGVSIDSLLIVAPAQLEAEIKTALNGVIKVDEVGHVESGSGAEALRDGERFTIAPKFRESAYTPVKKVVGEHADAREIQQMRARVDLAAARALSKKEQMIAYLRTGDNLPDVSC